MSVAVAKLYPYQKRGNKQSICTLSLLDREIAGHELTAQAAPMWFLDSHSSALLPNDGVLRTWESWSFCCRQNFGDKGKKSVGNQNGKGGIRKTAG